MAYSCVPTCCFNHVCAACRASFTISTVPAGGEVPLAERAGLSAGPPCDPTAPTTSCARCGSLAVSSGRDPEPLACGSCYALLALRLEDIARNG
ncbi:MAG: hypothetical protein L0216_21895 [Planctomycetales bacterium]|nr:hypothetical protein [Planctomycetales bacterium]